MPQQFFSLTSARLGNLTIQNSVLRMVISDTVASAALVAYNTSNLIVINTEMHFFCKSTMMAGVVMNVVSTITTQNMTCMHEMNQSSATNTIGGVCLNFTGTTITLNASRLNIDTNADFACLLARYMSSANVLLNMTYMGGYINGSNTNNISLLVGITTASSNLTMNTSQLCVFSNGLYSYFSLGTIVSNSSATHT